MELRPPLDSDKQNEKEEITWNTGNTFRLQKAMFTIGAVSIGVWQGVAMNSLKFHLGPPCPTLLCPAGGSPLKWPYGRFRGGPPEDGRPVAVFYPFGHPTPYAYDAVRIRFKSLGLERI
jgi:hypothetical protein